MRVVLAGHRLTPTLAALVTAGGLAAGVALAAATHRVHFPTTRELAVLQMGFRPSPAPGGLLSAHAALGALRSKGVLVRYPSTKYRERFGYYEPLVLQRSDSTAVHVSVPAWEITFAVKTEEAASNTAPRRDVVVMHDRTYFVDARTGDLLEAIPNHCGPCEPGQDR